MPALALSPAARWLIGLLIVLAMCGASFHFGVEWQEGVEAKEKVKEGDEARAKLVKSIEDGRKATAELAALLKNERAGRTKDQVAFEEKLKNAPRETIFETDCRQQPNPVRIAAGGDPVAGHNSPAQGISEPASSETPGAQGNPSGGLRPGARLSAIGCGLWNAALFAGFTEAERGQLPPGADACAGPVESDEAMRNLRANAALLGECRLREQQTQKRLKDLGITKEAQ